LGLEWGLAVRRKAWQRRRQTLNAMDLHRLLNRLKRTARYGWLYEVSKCAPQEALRDLDRAYTNWWRSHKQGRRVGRPRFKKKGRCPERFRLTGAIRVEQDAVVLPRIGRVRTKEATGKFCGRILSATCRREADRWYVAFTVEVARPDPVTVTGPVVGVDRGIRTFAVCSTGPGSTAPGRLRVACAGCGVAAGRSPASSLARPTAVGRCWRWPDTTAASATSVSMRCTRPPRHWRKPSQ
jgi:putative transposase